MISRAPASAPVGARAASGFMLMSGQSLLTRVATLLGQWVLAWMLLPEDFGLFAVAMGVVSFASVLQQNGVREVLIARQRRFERWANCGAWVSIVCGVVAAGLIAACAPLVARFYHEPRLVGLMLVLAGAQPFYGLAVAQEAKLSIDLRFRALAACNLTQGLLTPALMAGFAAAGFGVYAFVLPRLAAGVVRVVMLHWLVRVPLRADPEVRLWKYVLAPGAVLLATALVNNVAPAAPGLILAKLNGKDVAGQFGFAFNIAIQGVVLLGTTLDGVMFPTLAKLGAEPERQLAAYLRATRVLSAAAVPMGIMQALTARPGFRLLFGGRWDDAVPIAQVLSVGMIYLAVFIPASSLLLAQGRFATRFWIGLAAAVWFVGTCFLGAWLDGGVGVAVALALLYAVSGPVVGVIAVRPMGGTWGQVVGALGPSHAVGVVAGAAGLGAMMLVHGEGNAAGVGQIAAAGAAFGAVYALGLWWVARRTWDDLARTVGPVLARAGIGRTSSEAGRE